MIVTSMRLCLTNNGDYLVEQIMCLDNALEGIITMDAWGNDKILQGMDIELMTKIAF